MPATPGLYVLLIMPASTFHIRSDKFPVLQEDHDECCNPGTYGKSLVDYLQTKLESLGYLIAFTVAEDFGWWIEIKTDQSASTHIALRRSHEESGLADFAISLDDSPKKWSWKRFRFVDLSIVQENLSVDVYSILKSDSDIEFLADNFDDYPDHRVTSRSRRATGCT